MTTRNQIAAHFALNMTMPPLSEHDQREIESDRMGFMRDVAREQSRIIFEKVKRWEQLVTE